MTQMTQIIWITRPGCTADPYCFCSFLPQLVSPPFLKLCTFSLLFKQSFSFPVPFFHCFSSISSNFFFSSNKVMDSALCPYFFYLIFLFAQVDKPMVLLALALICNLYLLRTFINWNNKAQLFKDCQ